MNTTTPLSKKMPVYFLFFTLMTHSRTFGTISPVVGAVFGGGTTWSNTANLQTSNNAY